MANTGIYIDGSTEKITKKTHKAATKAICSVLESAHINHHDQATVIAALKALQSMSPSISGVTVSDNVLTMGK